MKRYPTIRSGGAIALILACALAVSSCATDPRKTGSISGPGGKPLASMTVPELQQATRYYGERYEKRPKDRDAGLLYAKSLQMTGRAEQSLAVMQQVVIHHPQDNAVLGEYGKALASVGNLPKALEIIERAQRPDHPDWKLFSAHGAILDQLGRPKEARRMYQKALDIVPSEPSVLSNMGMSYLLHGDLRSAETFLKKANSQRGADSRVRQNLALVVGLQGRFDEAKRIASAELPPAEAQANVDYLQQMLAQQNAWQQLKKEEG